MKDKDIDGLLASLVELDDLRAENARLKAERVHDLNQIGGLQEEVASLTESRNRHREINDELDARCNQLKAEVAELKNQPDPLTAYLYAAELAKNDRKILKAEVERLKNNCDYLDQKLDEEIDKSAMLCGQVERLRKAGDAMAKVIDDDYLDTLQVWIDWTAAKEGKPSV